MALSRHDRKIVDWDFKHQHKQTNILSVIISYHNDSTFLDCEVLADRSVQIMQTQTAHSGSTLFAILWPLLFSRNNFIFIVIITKWDVCKKEISL